MTGRAATAAGVALALVLVSCGGGDDGTGGGGPAGASRAGLESRQCELDALDEAVEAGEGPVEITLWHGLSDLNAETVEQLAEEFNDSQDDIRVDVVPQPGASDTITNKLTSGISTGDLPDVAMVKEIDTELVLDMGITLPVEGCVEAADYDMSDFLPRAVDYYTVEDVLTAMPFNVASPVLIYNVDVFEDAGLDPAQPPETLEELQEMAGTIRQAGFDAGLGLQRFGWYFEQFIALAGESYVDQGNGRDGRADAVAFGGDAGLEVFTAVSEMLSDGSALATPEGAIDHLTGLANGRWGMTTSSSSALGPALAVLATGQYADTDFQVAPMPGQTEEGGTVVGGGALHIVSGTEPDPVREAAAWRFIEYLSTVESSASWSARTGYVPVRVSAVDEQVLQDRWTEAPYFRVPYDQLLSGAENQATSGAVSSQLENIRKEVEEAWRRMDVDDLSPEEALAEVVDAANTLIEDYNDRVGA